MTETRQCRDYGTADIPSHWKAVLIVALWLVTTCSALPALFVPVHLVTVITAVSQTEAGSVEYQLKAAFLFNFMKFIEWPQTSPEEESQKTPITLCIIGTDFFGSHLDDLTKKEIKQRPLRILRLEGFEEYQKKNSNASRQQYFQEQKKAMEGCHLLFISQSEEKQIQELKASIDVMPILTVSDISGFADGGGEIELVKDENKIRFDVNVISAEKKGLRISSQLLQLAKKVYKK
jgi:hypothetical protein